MWQRTPAWRLVRTGQHQAVLTPLSILVADDVPAHRALIAGCLRDAGYTVIEASDGTAALDAIAASNIHMVISDVQMPGATGIELLPAIRARLPHAPILLVTAYPDVRAAVGAIKVGALDYLAKPIDFDELLDIVGRSLGTAVADQEHSVQLPEGVVAQSPAMRHLLWETKLVAASTAAVLVTGESGTGKEILADLIHAWSARSAAPIVKLNCAAIPPDLFESEIFGHEKGAFTGADATRSGSWERANGGTLFLDEIGDMLPALQAKLLRVLNDGTFSRVGSSETRVADVRVVAATNKDLEQHVASGTFREDLYYRLNVVELHMLPLRERREDILPLARLCARTFSGGSARLSVRTEAMLLAHSWPGNVRELRNLMERACLLARGDVVMPEHLPARLAQQAQPPPTRPENPARLVEVERQIILAALERHHGNRTRAALELGISRRTLIYRLKQYASEHPSSSP